MARRTTRRRISAVFVGRPGRRGTHRASSPPLLSPTYRRAGSLRVRIGNREVALANRGEEVHALETACSHAGGPIGDTRLKSDCFVECPWHNAVFDVRNGEPKGGPARKPLRTYPVRIADGTIFVAINERA